MNKDNEMLPMKELAAAMKISTRTIIRAKKRGFKMPGKRATVAEYRAWHDGSSGNVTPCHGLAYIE